MLSHRVWILFLSLSTATLSLAATTGKTSFSGNDTNIPIPSGYCLLSAGEQADNRLIQYLKAVNANTNEVVHVFSDCNQLRSWRRGQLPSLDDYGYVLSPSLHANQKTTISLNRFLSHMLTVFEAQDIEVTNESIDKLEEKVSKLSPTMKLNETTNLGVLNRDSLAIYLGVLQNVTPEEGNSKDLLGFYALTLVDERIFNLYLWRNHQGVDTILELDRLIESWVSETHAIN